MTFELPESSKAAEAEPVPPAALPTPTPPPLVVAGGSTTERYALRVLQAGALAIVVVAATYKAFELDRFFVPKELVLHLTALLAGWFALRARRRFVFTWVDLLLAGFLVLGLVSAIFATNMWLAQRALMISASGVAIFWAARSVRDAGLARPLIAALAAAVVLAALTSLLQTYGVRTDFFSINRAPGGTLGNRNFVAHLAAFGFPVILLAALNAERRASYIVGVIAATIVAASLVLTRSRAGWLASGAVIFVFAIAMLVSPVLRQHRRTKVRIVVILIAAGIGVAAALLIPNRLRWRGDNPYLESFVGVANFQEGSGRGRLVQYRQSFGMAMRNPLLGVGPGNWSVEYPRHAARRDPSLDNNEPGMTSNPWPSSDWVAYAAERGLPAALLLVAAIAGIALQGLRQLRRADSPAEGLGAAALLGTLLAALVAGMFDAVLLLALPTLLVWATLGVLWSPAPPPASFTPGTQKGKERKDQLRYVLIALIIAAALGTLRSATQLVAMGMYAQGNTRALSTAALLDPGNYRVRLRLAKSGRASRCKHARAAHALYPTAAEARDLSRRCGDR